MDNIIIENAKIMFRNFSGEKTEFNTEGTRNFCVRIEDQEVANQLNEDGWNVKVYKPRDPDAEPITYIPVSIRFDVYPANVILHSGKASTRLDEDTIGQLDFAEIKNVDLVIRPYQWQTRQGSGVKAYVKTMHVTIVEDPFAAKYAEEESPSEEVPWR